MEDFGVALIVVGGLIILLTVGLALLAWSSVAGMIYVGLVLICFGIMLIGEEKELD